MSMVMVGAARTIGAEFPAGIGACIPIGAVDVAERHGHMENGGRFGHACLTVWR